MYDSFGFKLPFLSIEDWEELAYIDYMEKKFPYENDKIYQETQYKQEIFHKLVEKLEKYPSIKTIKNRLGIEEGEKYRMHLEELEKKDIIDIINHTDDDQPKKMYTKKELEEYVDLVQILAEGGSNMYEIVDVYKEYKNRKKIQNKAKRLEEQQNFKPIITKLMKYNIWIPYKDDYQKWLNLKGNGLNPKMAKELYKQVDLLKRRFKKTGFNVLQHVSKRRPILKNIIDVERNIKVIKQYLKEK